jgi:hypothetical protein
MYDDGYDYRHTEEARQRELKIIWRCDHCGREREDYPGYNEGGPCHYCNKGHFWEAGESYAA